MTDTVEASKRYTLEKYGEVQVLSISRWIDAANADGVVEDRLVVEFDTNPDDGSTRDQLRRWEVGEFIEAIDHN